MASERRVPPCNVLRHGIKECLLEKQRRPNYLRGYDPGYPKAPARKCPVNICPLLLSQNLSGQELSSRQRSQNVRSSFVLDSQAVIICPSSWRSIYDLAAGWSLSVRSNDVRCSVGHKVSGQYMSGPRSQNVSGHKVSVLLTELRSKQSHQSIQFKSILKQNK